MRHKFVCFDVLSICFVYFWILFNNNTTIASSGFMMSMIPLKVKEFYIIIFQALKVVVCAIFIPENDWK